MKDPFDLIIYLTCSLSMIALVATCIWLCVAVIIPVAGEIWANLWNEDEGK